MTPDVIAQLNKEQPTPFHEQLLSTCKALVKGSRSKMSQRYSEWDKQDQVYRGERWPDEEDRRMHREEKPTKMVVPNNFAQCMTFTSFQYLMFNQNRNFFELLPSGADNYGKKDQDCEAVLQRDWRRNQGNKLLFQFLLDVPRFGLAPLEVSWTKQMSRIYVTPNAPVVQTLNGVEMTSRAGSGWEEYVKYEGNYVRNVSPYRWFPDTSFPICDFAKSKSFCAAEEDFTMNALRDLQSSGEVAGIDFIQSLPREWQNARGGESRLSFTPPNSFDPSKGGAMVVVTKIQVWIVPSKYTFSEGKKLGPEEFPVLYHVWYANDNRIIRAEPAYWWHNEFGWTLGQFTPDMHETTNGLSLAGLIYHLQDVISWFVNSHITSVRRVIQNRNIINPAFVETKSYDGEGDIFIRKGVGRVDPKLAVAQLPAQDVTSGHMNDVDILGKLMQTVTGVNDNAMGQYNSGRRSASEARVVTAGAASRMKMHGGLLWETGLGRLGRLMLSNSRQSLSQESFVRAVGIDPQTDMNLRFAKFQSTPADIVAGDDYMVFDSTLSSEKAYMAQNLQELLQVIFQSNPMAAQQFAMKIDPTQVMDELQYLRDGSPIDRFYYPPGEGPMVAPPTVVPPVGQPNPATIAQ